MAREENFLAFTKIHISSPSAPFIGILASKIDNRLLGVIGGVVSGLSVIGASFAVNVPVLVLFLSISNGM